MQSSYIRLMVACLAASCAAMAPAQTTISGNSLAFKSSGTNSGSDWVLNENGYLGTYITLAEPGQVAVTAQASGAAGGGSAPRMNIVVADTQAGFDVSAGFNDYQHTFDLPAGTYFVRTEFNNDVPSADRRLTVRNLSFSGAAVSNTSNGAVNNVSALAAADTYIENFRRGTAHVELMGAAPGSSVRAKLKRHDFRFGTAVGGTFVGGGGNAYDVNTYLNNSDYSNFLVSHFNTITQGNAGKWAYNEGTRDVVTMQAVDRILQFAEDHDLDVRLHNMLWGDSQQPTWVDTLLNSAASGNQTAENDLRTEISERIDHYVGNGDANPLNDRARRYHEMDLLNEHSHKPKYWDVYGATGIAGIFNEADAAVSAANSNAKLYLNEYNVFTWGDVYANWYRQDVDEIVNNGGAIGGIGIQYYPSALTGSQAHSPARMYQTLQNLSVTGLDISLTEFGVSTANGTTVQNAATYLEDTMRLVFGTPNATTFMMWGFWANDVWDQAPLAALRDSNWNPTLPGTTYDALMSEWDTDVELLVGPEGTIDFTGFYGEYEVTVDGKTFALDFTKGTTDYTILVGIPGDFDDDLVVDAADLAIWQAGYGVDASGDADFDGDTDGRDFLIWQRNLTQLAAMNASAAVPEPTTASLAIAAMLAATLGRVARSRPFGRAMSGRAD